MRGRSHGWSWNENRSELAPLFTALFTSSRLSHRLARMSHHSPYWDGVNLNEKLFNCAFVSTFTSKTPGCGERLVRRALEWEKDKGKYPNGSTEHTFIQAMLDRVHDTLFVTLKHVMGREDSKTVDEAESTDRNKLFEWWEYVLTYPAIPGRKSMAKLPVSPHGAPLVGDLG